MRFWLLAALLIVNGCAALKLKPLSKQQPRLSDERILARVNCFTLPGGIDVFTDGTTPCPERAMVESALWDVTRERDIVAGDLSDFHLIYTAHEIDCGGTPAVGCTDTNDKRMTVVTFTLWTRQHTWHELSHAAIFVRGDYWGDHMQLDYSDREDFDDR